VVLAISAWDVRTAPPADKLDMMVWLYLPDMRYSLSHTLSGCVDKDRQDHLP
jgi:hypothetical protein